MPQAKYHNRGRRNAVINEIEDTLEQKVTDLLERDNPPKNIDVTRQDMQAIPIKFLPADTFYSWDLYGYFLRNYPSMTKPERGRLRIDIEEFAANNLEVEDE